NLNSLQIPLCRFVRFPLRALNDIRHRQRISSKIRLPLRFIPFHASVEILDMLFQLFIAWTFTTVRPASAELTGQALDEINSTEHDKRSLRQLRLYRLQSVPSNRGAKPSANYLRRLRS